MPLIGTALRRAGHVFLDRANTDAAIRQMDEVVSTGLSQRSFLLFPEGTRSKEGIMPFKKGPFHMALAARAVIVPVALAGSDDMRQLDPTRNTIRVAFGCAIEVTGQERIEDLVGEVRSKIVALNEWMGGKGAMAGTESSHVAHRGNPTKKSGLKAWCPDA